MLLNWHYAKGSIFDDGDRLTSKAGPSRSQVEVWNARP